MKLYEFTFDKKSNKEKIIINFPDKKDFKFLRSLEGSLYYYNTNIFILYKTEQNILNLYKNNYLPYNISDTLRIKKGIIQNNYLKIYPYTNSGLYSLMKNYTYTDTSECYQFGRFDAKKIKKIYFWKLENNYIKIPIGFKNDFFEYNIEEKRLKRKFKFTDNEIKNCFNYLELRNIQIEAIKSCFKNTNGIIDLVGGLGKTEIALALIKLMKVKTLFITQSIDLAKQTMKRGIKAELDFGIVQGNNIDEKNITVCTIQSSHKLQNSYEMVIVDECHNISSGYIPILENENILYRFGLSATPFNSDKLKTAYIKSFIGDIIFKADNQELIDNKFIAEPIINIIEISEPNLEDINNWYLIEKLGIIENRNRNNKILEICKSKKGILILVKKVNHGKILEKLLKENNIDCIYIHGKSAKQERQEVLEKFEKDNNFVLIGSNILKEGISINSIFNLILAGGGQSYFDSLQSLYRGTRVKLKDQFNVYDFMDSFNRITLRHSKQRIKDYSDKGFNKINYI